MNRVRHTAPFLRQQLAWRIVPLLVLLLFVVSADLWHEAVHDDAGSADHDCSVLHWQGGELGFAATGLSFRPPVAAVLPPARPGGDHAPGSVDSFPTAARAPPLA
ncbi:MAG TPA: hypothetical protein DCY13_20520 [Verrucomicrobiales bacterium]|nr:hypothetical protein [Verrucomicrobiales bacterium]